MFSKIKNKIAVIQIILVAFIGSNIYAYPAAGVDVPDSEYIIQAEQQSELQNITENNINFMVHTMSAEMEISEQPIKIERWMIDLSNDKWGQEEPEVDVEQWMYDLTSWG